MANESDIEAGQEPERKLEDVFRGCSRFLGYDRARSMRDVLAEVAEEAGPDERPDNYGSGEVIEAFEAEVAILLGHEAALFFPSGTMAQQIALRIWCERRGCNTVAFHPTCHLEGHEQDAYRVLAGLRGRLTGSRTAPPTLEDLEAIKEPLGALLLELPQREIGGALPAWEDLIAQLEWARARGIATHMDGARLWEAGPYYERPYAEIAGAFDSVYVSFYKGIGAIAGAALAGSAPFIDEARVWQRRYGGNLVQLYPLVLSARRNLRRSLDRFPAYYHRAVEIAAVLSEVPGVRITPNPPQTNMMHVYLPGERGRLIEAAVAIAEREDVCLFWGLRQADVPGYCAFELVIHEGSMHMADDEIERLFREVVAAGGK